MTLTSLKSAAFFGIEAIAVDVEVDAKNADRFSMMIIGLPDLAVKESKDRVLTALRNSQLKLNGFYAMVNLAPADLKKEGSLYDLPIALGLLVSTGVISTNTHKDYICCGELSLNGQTRPMRGALSIALMARAMGKKGVILPLINAKEAAAVPGIEVIGVDNLVQACQFLRDPGSIPPLHYNTVQDLQKPASTPTDFADIKGQAHVKRALEIAASGGHNVLLYGPPGSGKTLLAKALNGILPPMSLDEALEVTKIHSIAGTHTNDGLVVDRPFRSPHHTISAIGLVGGGSFPKPGEISLAHHGVLFLDELPEFSRNVLEVMRQPLENRKVTIARAQCTLTFPTECIFIAAMNPCPCGLLGHPKKACRDTPLQIQRYRGKISAPLLDRIDMYIEVPQVGFTDLNAPENQSETSKNVRARVVDARIVQNSRLGEKRFNALMGPKEISKHCKLNDESQKLMEQVMERMGISARGLHRIYKLARTIADLEKTENLERHHLMEAVSFRAWES